MKKYENFLNAFENLKDIYNYDPPYGNVEMTGLVSVVKRGEYRFKWSGHRLW